MLPWRSKESQIEKALLAAIALVPENVRQCRCDGRMIGANIASAEEYIRHGEYGVAYEQLLYLAEECFAGVGFSCEDYAGCLDDARRLMKI